MLALFHLLAVEGAGHTDRDHQWHMHILAILAGADLELLLAATHGFLNLHESEAISGVVEWWHELTAAGGEGIVVKPPQSVAGTSAASFNRQ